ncbi:MAG: hypothetical protein ACD_19C00163G0002, partial [uncultured bacterium]
KKQLYFQTCLVVAAIFLFTIMHIYFTDKYLNEVKAYRSIEIDSKLWGQITKEVPTINNNSVSVFYLISEPQDALIAEWTLRFEFVGRSALYYQITNENMNPFMIVNDYKDLFSTITDGERLARQGKPREPLVLINDVYAFHLKDKELTNVTDEVREMLKIDYQKYLKRNI